MLTLTSFETKFLVHLMRLLITPLDFDLASWSTTLAESARATLGTDQASVVLKSSESTTMVGSFDDRAMREYQERWFATMPGDARRRAAHLTSWVRSDVWSFAELQPLAYYHEWCVPNGNQDSAGMCAYHEDGEVAVYINSSRPGHFPVGGRHAALLELLQPSLAAGTAMLRAFGDDRTRHGLDAAPSPFGIFRIDGTLVHAGPQFSTLLTGRDGALLLRAAHTLIRDTSAALRPGSSRVFSPQLAVATSKAKYILHVSMVDSDVFGVERLCVVTVKAPRAPMDERTIRKRFPLTAREAKVASLLAAGYRNAAIARTLRISEHTARHHTERILNKLGLTSRAQVAAKLVDETD